MPSFSIEAPGEANPLTEDTLLHALQAAASSDPAQLQSGTKQLQQWERSPGFYKHLQSVYITPAIPEHVRFLAIIFLKNGIDKYWRKTATNAVNSDDKSVIRSRLISSVLGEPSRKLYRQNALVVAKIVRFEYPGDWPSALSQLLGTVQETARTDDGPVLDRTLVIVLFVVKELSTGRLLRTRQVLQAAAPELLSSLTDLYLNKFNQWHGQGALFAEKAAESSLLTLKIIRRLLIAGFAFPHREDYLVLLWSTTRNHFDSLISIFSAGDGLSHTQDWKICAEKHVLQLSKLHLNMATTHPASFVLLPGSVDLMLLYWNAIRHFAKQMSATQDVVDLRSADEQDKDPKTFETLALRGILLTHACIRMIFNPVQTFKYRHEQEKAEKVEAESTMRNTLFTDDRVRELMLVLVSDFFSFTPLDLIEWRIDAEEWESKADSGSEGYEYSIRLSSERTFLSLIINFKDLLTQPLLDVFTTAAQPDNADVLLKDSVYSAIGLSAAVLHQRLDFDAFLTNTLANEVQIEKPGYNIIRRRIAVMIGQWAPVRLSKANRPLVYQIFQHLLQPSEYNDLVVRITAGRYLRDVVDDWEFIIDGFLPFAEDLMTRLIRLVEEVEGTDTKMMLLDTIGVLVARLENHIAPFSNSIIMLLPSLWEQAADENLMKQAILALLVRLVTALKADSVPFHAIFIHIVEHAITPDSDTQLYLLEDALDLWHAMLVQSSPPALPDLLKLIKYLLNVFELGSDSLRKALEIAESYLLLSPEQMLAEDTRRPIFAAMANLLDRIKPEVSGLVNNFIENALRTAERLGGEAAVEAVTVDLVSSTFLPKQLEGIHSAFVAHCTTGPHAKAPSVDGVIETDYFSVLARICMGSTGALLRAVEACAPMSSANANSADALEDKMKWLLEEWFNHLENIGDPSRRKLKCLAVTKLLATNQPFILSHLQLLMTLWTDVVTELRDLADVENGVVTDPFADSLVYDVMSKPEEEELGPPAREDIRRKELSATDAVHTIKLAEWIRYHLSAAVGNAGGDGAFREMWLVNVDGDVARSFANLGIM